MCRLLSIVVESIVKSPVRLALAIPPIHVRLQVRARYNHAAAAAAATRTHQCLLTDRRLVHSASTAQVNLHAVSSHE